MRIKINGEAEDIEAEKLTVIDLLRLKNVESPEMVSVQLNGDIIERQDYETTGISADDELDFLYFMGGGSL
ncbi:MAG: sulfur carrier protein ThiS [Deltaproteobacteria bacterium]|nr:sulfur carrier protein ThiS [Deltaproteobacteria bacterium]